MCEPAHSIVQFPIEDEIGQPTKPLVDLALVILKPTELIVPERPRIIVPQGIVIGPYVNYSNVGSGHSETLRRLTTEQRGRLPEDIKYEAFWWERTVRADMPYYNRKWQEVPDWQKEESLGSAEEYAQRSSIGTLQILRRFIEASLQQSSRPKRYVAQFMLLLSPLGREKLGDKLRSAFHGKRVSVTATLAAMLSGPRGSDMERAIGIMLAMTRRREYLCDAWADDVTLWAKIMVQV